MAADGSIIIDTHIDNEGANKELQKLRKDILKLQSSLSTKKAQRSDIEKQMQQADAAIEATYQNIKRLEAELAKLQGVNLKDNTSAEYFAAQTRIPQIKAELEAQNAVLDKQGKTGDGIAAKYEKISGEVAKIENELEDAAKRAGQLAKQVDGVGDAGKGAARSINKAAGETAKFKKRLVELTKSALIFSVITKALTLMRNELAGMVQTNEEAKKSFAQLKGSLKGLVTPILNAALPALVKIVQALTQVISLISRGIAALFGTTYEEAMKNAESLNAEQEALEGVGDAAEEAEGQLASFDEINKLSGAAASSAADESDISFEEVALPDWMLAASERLAEAFSNLRDAIAGFKDNKVLNKLAEFMKYAAKEDASGTIEGVANSVNLLAVALSLLDDLLSGDFKGAGESLKELFGSFDNLKGIDLTPLGKAKDIGLSLGFLAGESIRKYFKNIEWSQIFGTMKTGFQNTWSSITNWWSENFVNIDMKQALNGASLAGYLVGQHLGESFREVWNNEVKTWWTDEVKPWFKADKWLKLFSDAENGVKKGWNSINAWWESTALVKWWDENVAPWFTPERWEALWSGAGKGVTQGWGSVVSWWKKSALASWWKEQVSPWFAASKWKELWSGVKTGFREGWDGVKSWWSSTIATWWSDHVAVWFTADKWREAMSGLKSAFKDAFTDAVNEAIAVLNKLIFWMNEALSFEIPEFTLMGETIWESRNITLAQLPSIPYLATGAVIPPNREFLAVLGDQTSGNNIEAPEELIRKIVREESGGGSEQLLREILAAIREGKVMMVDRKKLGEIVAQSINDRTRASGASPVNVW